MEALIVILVVAGGVLFWRRWMLKHVGKYTSSGSPLSSRLHELATILDPAVAASAYPSALAGLQEFNEAVGLLLDESVSCETVKQYALGDNFVLSCVGLAALAQRPDGAEAASDVVASFDNLGPWTAHFALQYLLAVEPRPPVGAPMIGAQDWWRDNAFLRASFRDYLSQRESLKDAPDFGSALQDVSTEQGTLISAFLTRLRHSFARPLLDELNAVLRATVDRDFLTSFGRFWSDEVDLSTLIVPEPWREFLNAAAASSVKPPTRCLLVSGNAGVGKTSFLKLLAQQLGRDGWQIFEASGADLMAGQQLFGQLEGRIQRAIEALAVEKKLIWYIPDILQVAQSGMHQGQTASILDQILGPICAGRIVIWAEASPEATSRLLRSRPVLRGHMDVIRLEPLDQGETVMLAHQIGPRLSEVPNLDLEPASVDVAVSLAQQYLGTASFPGSVLDLVKLTADRVAKSGQNHIASHDVIVTLSRLSGLPASILDDGARVDIATIRAYFASRVIGQDEAIAAVVDRIAMLKAGLNDPGKPIGVFLFAGPTGTGKTELAKTLSTFLFGSDDRMVRLDMSEFQTPESMVKILGSSEAPAPTDSLITRVRRQPFSVVLLDEFEKAHANIWDLFLQVFDDGRLTDQLGQVADFRHCIIILTTNLGATSHRSAGLGFSPARHAYSNEQVLKAVGQAFRPEFQNRLDKVIVFRELSRGLMRNILKKELAQLFERRGLKDREWAVEWEVSALEFLLEKGFSPEMGARPLKRAIEQYVVAPLAAAIVEKRLPKGDQFVFVRSDGREIYAEFVDPDNDVGPAEPVLDASDGKHLALPAMILAPTGKRAELMALDAEWTDIEETMGSAEWHELKASLSENMLDADFWKRPERHDTLARLALMDRTKAAAATAASLRTRLAKGTERSGNSSRQLIQRLALQLHLVKQGITDVFKNAPVEVAVVVEPTLVRKGDRQAAMQWCAQLMDMYRAWARNRHMQIAELANAQAPGRPILLIGGFGAYRQLEREAGLHVLELTDRDASTSRATVRVRVATTPRQDLPQEKVRLALHDAFRRAGSSSTVVRRYRGEPSPLVRDVIGGWRSGRFEAVLRGDFDLIAMSQA